ncbi:cytochrome P450 [Hypoxylon crocopeplum]|nr:cytochrome P450 [Hypoxylon crocopeplum]
MDQSMVQLYASVFALFIPLVCLIVASRSEIRHRHSALFKVLPAIGRRDEWFSSLRAQLRSVLNTADWASEGYTKFTKHNAPYLIETLDRGPVILLPSGQIKTVHKLPEGRLDVFGTLQEQIQVKYTVRDLRVIHDPYHRYLIPSQLTRKLNLLTEPMVTEIEDAFKSSWALGTEWQEVPIWKGCFQAIARATNSALCGSPLCKDEKYIKSLEGQSIAFFSGSTLISMIPGLLRPIAGYLVRLWCIYYARKITKICAPYIEQRISETMGAKAATSSSQRPVKDGLQLIIDEAISRDDITQLSVKLITDRLLITNNGTLHGVAFTVHHALLSLVSSEPSLGYIEALREECRNVLSDASRKWSLEAVRKLRLVDSTIRESMRIVPFGSVAMARTVIDPQGISIDHDGSSVLIPQGTKLALPIENIHYDENIYPQAQQFNPFRFVNFEPQDGESKGQRYTTTADDQFFGFGTSKNPCPGRFFAVHEIKLIIAYILLNYDIESAKLNYQPSNLLAMKVPKTDICLRMRRRPV